VVQLTDPVAKWLPAFKDVKVSTGTAEVAAERAPTVQDLLRHTAGLAYGEITQNAAVKEQLTKAGIYKPGNIDFDDVKVAVDFDDAWAGIFSVGYMFDEHWAGEMYFATPFQTDLTIKDVGEGEADVWPLTFSALYYFNPNGHWRPYLGAGINFTEFSGEKPNELHLGGSIGPAATAGIDFLFTRHWFATLDLRWIYVQTEVQANGSQNDYGDLQLSPLVAGAMVGYRFGGRRPPAVEAPPPPVAAPVAAAPAPVAPQAPGTAAMHIPSAGGT